MSSEAKESETKPAQKTGERAGDDSTPGLSPGPGLLMQAVLARALVFLVRLLPVGVASGLGGWLARTVGPWLSVSKMARRNLARAFPEKSASDIEDIILGVWDNFGRTAFEFPNLHKIRFDGNRPHVEIIGAAEIENARPDGGPCLFFTVHLGNWELALKSVVHQGLTVHTFFRDFNNPLMKDILLNRNAGDAQLIPKGPEGAKRAMRLLKSGEHIGMLPDQKLNEGIPVPFFGRDAMTAPALAQFAMRFGCPVIPARVERLKGVSFRITFYPPMKISNTGDRQADIHAFMTAINQLLESWIRERPEQWLWLHRRWPEN